MKSMSSYSSNQKNYQKPVATQEAPKEGICTMFLINVAKGKMAFRYDVDITLNLGTNIPPKKLSKGADDGQRALNRKLCSRLLKVAQNKTDFFDLGLQCPIVYDNKCILFTPTKIKSDRMNISIALEEVDDFVRTYCSYRASFTVKISPTSQGSHVLDLNDINQYISHASLEQEDHSLRTFLELATSQHALDNNLYTAIGSAKLYQNNEEKIGHGIVLRPGITRGTRVVQNFYHPMPALVLDAQVSPFYAAQPLLNTIMEINGNREPRSKEEWNRTFNLLKDVRVCVTYNRRRSFGIRRFTQEEVAQILVFKEENSGRMVFIPEYYNQIKFEQYNVRVSNLTLRGVIPNTPPRDPNNLEVFPVECLEVMEHQKVPMEKTQFHNTLSTDLIKVNVVPPRERNKQVLDHANRLGIFDKNNAVLTAFGISIEQKTFNVPIEKQQCSDLKYGDKKIVTPYKENATWNARASKYISPATVSIWIVVCHAEHVDLIVKPFVKKFMEDCKSRGIQFLAGPKPITFDGPINLEDTFKKCVENKVEFVLLIDPISSETHGALKYYEAVYKVASQHITLKTAEKVVKHNQGKTMENIINKTNCKLNGLNYEPLINDLSNAFSLEKKNILVIGYDVAHPTSGSSFDPSVVGICANMAPNVHNFVGDYFYQASCKESVDSDQLSERIIWILKTLKRNRPTNRPKTVIILRDGLSEGQFIMAVKEELATIRQAFAICGIKDEQIKYVFVIATKRHNKRFFLGELGQTLENVAPGSIIDQKFVREDVLEWFQLSHKAIKGTAQVVQYGVPVNEPNISAKDLQAFLTTLCFSHQIVNCAVSLPEPVYQADELAKRGFNNYVSMKKINPTGVPMDAITNQVDARALSKILSYKDSKLESTRVTA